MSTAKWQNIAESKHFFNKRWVLASTVFQSLKQQKSTTRFEDVTIIKHVIEGTKSDKHRKIV